MLDLKVYKLASVIFWIFNCITCFYFCKGNFWSICLGINIFIPFPWVCFFTGIFEGVDDVCWGAFITHYFHWKGNMLPVKAFFNKNFYFLPGILPYFALSISFLNILCFSSALFMGNFYSYISIKILLVMNNY